MTADRTPLWIVAFSTGEYEDQRDHLVLAFADEAQAETYRAHCETMVRRAEADFEALDPLPEPDDDASSEAWASYERRTRARERRVLKGVAAFGISSVYNLDARFYVSRVDLASSLQGVTA